MLVHQLFGAYVDLLVKKVNDRPDLDKNKAMQEREVTKKPNYRNKIIFEIIFLRNRKHVPCFYRVIETRVEVWENEKCCGNTSRRRVFPQLFRVVPNFGTR